MKRTPKILLLSCSTGAGHNSAAHALEEELLRVGTQTQLLDPVSFQSERAKRNVSACYNAMIRKTPRLFGAVYRVGDWYGRTGWTSPVYYANAHYADRLGEYLAQNGFDAVISTHLYGMEAMTALQKRGKTDVPHYGVLTDYTAIPFLEETTPNALFLPHEKQVQELRGRGVDIPLYPYGIPVSAAFSRHADRKTAREMLGLPQDAKICLVMTGGVGCEKVRGLCKELAAKGTGKLLSCVLTGHNDALADKLREIYRDDCIRVVPFTQEVARYMEAADVTITKAGGLSSTEAAQANVPIVHIGMIPGCESCNASFFAASGMSVQARTNAQAVEAALHLASSPVEAERMRTCQRNTLPHDAAQHIVKTVLEEVMST